MVLPVNHKAPPVGTLRKDEGPGQEQCWVAELTCALLEKWSPVGRSGGKSGLLGMDFCVTRAISHQFYLPKG